MLLSSSRASVAHHVLRLTLRRQRQDAFSASVPPPACGYSTAAMLAAGKAELQVGRSYEDGVRPAVTVEVDMDVDGSRGRLGKWAKAKKPPPQRRTYGLRRLEDDERGLAHEDEHEQNRYRPPAAISDDHHAVLHPLYFHNLLSLVYVVPADDILRHLSGAPDPPPHLPRSTQPPYKQMTLLATGAKPTDVIALAPPTSQTSQHWEMVLERDPEEAARAAYLLLRCDRPATLADWFPYLDRIHRCIVYLTPTTHGWDNLKRSQYHALLHLWAEYIHGIRMLHDMDALHDEVHKSVTYPHRLNRLVRLLTTTTVLDATHEPRDKRLRVPAPKNPPTLADSFALLDQLGYKPTWTQLATLVQKMPLAEILARASETHGEHEEAALNSAAQSIAATLANPGCFSQFVEGSGHGLGKYVLAEHRKYDFALGERAMSELEASASYDGTPSPHWTKVVDMYRPQWIDIVRRLAADRTSPDPLRARRRMRPTKTQTHACWLLLRDVLFRAPPKSLNVDPNIHGDFNFGNPFDILRLMFDTERPMEPETFRKGWNYASSAIVRIARAAAKRELFPRSLELATVVAENGIRIRLRTAVYIAGAARHPEDLVALLPVLSRLNVCMPQNDESREVMSNLLDLARQADREGYASHLPDSTIERDVVALFRGWRL